MPKIMSEIWEALREAWPVILIATVLGTIGGTLAGLLVAHMMGLL